MGRELSRALGGGALVAAVAALHRVFQRRTSPIQIGVQLMADALAEIRQLVGELRAMKAIQDAQMRDLKTLKSGQQELDARLKRLERGAGSEEPNPPRT